MKPFWKSKTLWVNVIATIALGYQTATGFVIAPEYQAYALAVVNFLLRVITKQELV